ncbi:HAD family hydrolase [Chitinivorax sp. B]|uniref:HAD family hydrolase n=1 Tax=Chitinivorax sp. B TaxID=2502235 RepID=UPI0010F54063|nr:HAD family hydrolase [Chitinivorax sp. B]
MFDVDGTLVDSLHYDGELFCQAVDEVLGIREINPDWRAYTHVTSSGILGEIVLRAFGRLVTEEESAAVQGRFNGLMRAYHAVHTTHCQPLPGGIPLWAALKQRSDVAIAIATGGWGAEARLKLEGCGYDLQQVPFAAACEATSRQAIMQLAHHRALTQYAVTAFDAVAYVGDGHWDQTATRSLGWRFVGVGAELQSVMADDELWWPGPPAVNELLECLGWCMASQTCTTQAE